MTLNTTDLSRVRRMLADQGTSETQSISIENATGGTFTISYAGQTTAAIPYGSGANVVQNALAALSNIGTGNVQVNNTSPYTVRFTGTLAHTAVAMLTVNSTSLTGIGVIVTITETTTGGVYAFSDAELNDTYDLANENLFLSVSYGYSELQGNAAKFNDYTAGQTSESKSQVFNNLDRMATKYEVLSQAGNQAQVIGIRAVPPRRKARPSSQGGTRTRTSGGWPPFPDSNDDLGGNGGL